MSRAATKWAYNSEEVLKLGLSVNELAVLRAICWKFRNETRRTDPVTNADLSNYTGIRSPDTLNKIRKRLRERKLIAFEKANKLPRGTGKRADKTSGKMSTLAYVYFVYFSKWEVY